MDKDCLAKTIVDFMEVRSVPQHCTQTVLVEKCSPFKLACLPVLDQIRQLAKEH